MEEVIYGDIYFIINFSMDFLVLYICGKIRRHKLKVIPLIFAASVGAIYALTALFTATGSIAEWLIMLCVAALMCYIAFNTPTLKSLLLTFIIYLSVNFLLSGGITALYRMLNNLQIGSSFYTEEGIGRISDQIPPIWLFLLALLSGAISLIWSHCMKKQSSVTEAAVHIEQNGNAVDYRGLCDSGNFLCEPISGRPVMILRHESFSALMSERFMKILTERTPELLSEEERRIIRFIPMQSVGGTGMLIGILPDRVTVNGEERDVCIAPDQHGNCDFCGYDLLLSPSLLS